MTIRGTRFRHVARLHRSDALPCGAQQVKGGLIAYSVPVCLCTPHSITGSGTPAVVVSQMTDEPEQAGCCCKRSI